MDRRVAMALSGSASYYMQRGMPGTGSGFQGSQAIPPFPNTNVPFQQNVEGSSISSTMPIEPMATVPPHGVNINLSSAVQHGQPVKRKRGRPRKYGPDGTVSLALTPSSTPSKLTSIQKRGRGRPPGSGRKQQLASCGQWLSRSAGMGFTPHVIAIAVGEDIVTKIVSFSHQGPRATCVLSANGAVSSVTLRQPSTSGGTVTYEGQFEILCLSGSYLSSDDSGSHGRTGGLSVSLASPDGRVIGGGVGGMLIAASPVQVIIGSFLCTKTKTKSRARESLDDVGDSDRQIVDNTSIPPNQNITPPMGVWSSSRPLDLQSDHIDIDLMRG